MQKIGRYFPASLALIFIVILADQYTKWLAMGALLHAKTITLAPFLDFVAVWNQGVSFGMFDAGGTKMPLLLIAVSLLISAGLLFWLKSAERKTVALALSLIVGGALGNVIDRLRFGAVADFIDVHAGNLHWPAFNLADSCISIGAAVLIVDSLLNKNHQEPA